ncbi:hypothetical protein LDG_7333 [Legionella drancourtii LLAP12]|uniref:Uncharacterized protein n=1 Tax=Legionella drancourtii LLAP12 TaxID=658187 RepID=G9EPZ2_9GAMM|nr:hypothetical protein LDG_7333 [Legionella drancourtii LLAP12]
MILKPGTTNPAIAPKLICTRGEDNDFTKRAIIPELTKSNNKNKQKYIFAILNPFNSCPYMDRLKCIGY